MQASSFFSRLLQAPRTHPESAHPDDVGEFDTAWQTIRETLEHPDERQLVRGIASTDVPKCLRQIVDALVYEGNRTEEDATGACLEYLLQNDLLANLERLCQPDRPHGIKAEVLRSINNLVVLLSERFLVHNAVHRPLRRLLRSCIGDEPEEGRLDGVPKVMGAADMDLDAREDLKAVRRQRAEALETELVDLMCILCSRMRAYPPLLLIFFHDKGWLQPAAASAPNAAAARALSPAPTVQTTSTSRSPAKTPQQFEFLLFSYLLRFVHREGRIGDFARAGLLFLFDIAFLAPDDEGGDNLVAPEPSGVDPLQDVRDALAEYILDGDFADVMAAGLGAVYSLLPTKLHVPTLAEQAEQNSEFGMPASRSGGMCLGAQTSVNQANANDEEELEEDIPLALAKSTDPEVRDQLEMLLRLFGFLQDILHRCNSSSGHRDSNESTAVSHSRVIGVAISDGALDTIRASFLEGILYPSILESSSQDGSAVAVMTYLDVILSNLDDQPLLFRILSYLLNIDVLDPSKSHDLEVELPERSNRYRHYDSTTGAERFTLRDLILDNIRSTDPAASTAALRLLRTMTVEHSHATMTAILRPIRSSRIRGSKTADLSSLTRRRDPNDVSRDFELYRALLLRLDPSQAEVEKSRGYAGYLADMQFSLEQERCSQPSGIYPEDGPCSSASCDHTPSPADPVVGAVLVKLGAFISQTPDENVALTGVIISLASCSQRSLSGWLLGRPSILDDGEASIYTAIQRRSSSKPHTHSNDPDDSIDSDDSDDDDPTPRTPGPSKLAAESDPFLSVHAPDPPVIYQVLLQLVDQTINFRTSISAFDRLLAERRRGLLFADNLDEAMNVMLTVESSVFDTPQQRTPTSSPLPKKRVGVIGSLASFLSPNRKRLNPDLGAGTSTSATPETPKLGKLSKHSVRDGINDVDNSPFKQHYEQLRDRAVHAAPVILANTPWMLGSEPSQPDEGFGSIGNDQPQLRGAAEEEPDDESTSIGSVRRVSLSQILDNCVVLEEFIKELVALLTVRRAMGLDGEI